MNKSSTHDEVNGKIDSLMTRFFVNSKGIKCRPFMQDDKHWKIASLVWSSEREGLTISERAE